MSPRQILASAVLLTGTLFSVGCISPPMRPAIHLDGSFDPQRVDTIALLPAVDDRADKTEKVNVQRVVASYAKRALKARGYRLENVPPNETNTQMVKEDIESPSEQWIRQLGPGDMNWIMIVVLDDVSTKLTFGSTGNADLTAYLFDKQASKLVWRDKGVGKLGQGGLVGMAMKGVMAESAIQIAIDHMTFSIPVKKKGK